MKRFTETTKWDDPWFMDLPVKYKAFWLYICDRCDNAGAWEPNMRLAATQVGEPLELVEILRVFAGRIKQLDDGKLWIEKFIPFQYGNLSPNCRAHIPILNNIEKLRVLKGYPKGIHTLVEKEKEKVQEKEGESEGVGGTVLTGEVLKVFNRDWIPVRKAMGKKPKDWTTMFLAQAKWLSQFKPSDQLEILSQSIRNNWQGLIEPKRNGKSGARLDVPEKLDPSKIDIPERFKSWAAENYPGKRESIMKWQTWGEVPNSLRQEWWRIEKAKLPIGEML